MACSAKVALAEALTEVMNLVGQHLPLEVEQRTRRVLDLHGSAASLRGACRTSRGQAAICDI